MARKHKPVSQPTIYLVALSGAGLFFWWQLYRLVTRTPPTTVNVVLALVLLFLATTSTGAVGSWAAHARLRRSSGNLLRFVRQGMWLGLLAVLYAWLSLLDVFSPLTAVVLFAIVVAAEVFVLLRESQQ